METSDFSSTHLRWEIMAIVTVGIDLAKNVFAVHARDGTQVCGALTHERQTRPERIINQWP